MRPAVRPPFEAAFAVLVGPQGDRAADDRTGRDRTEIAAVETVRDIPVHQEDIAFRDDTAALPVGQRTAGAVALERHSHLHAVDGDQEAGAADGLPGKAEHAFQERRVARQIPAIGEEARDGFGRIDRDQIGHFQTTDRLD